MSSEFKSCFNLKYIFSINNLGPYDAIHVGAASPTLPYEVY
jgi:hypothetical protein